MKSGFLISKRIIAALLVFMTVFGITACGGGASPADTTRPVIQSETTDQPTDERALVADSLPDELDLGGEKITILTRDSDGAATATDKTVGRSMYEDELSVEDLTNDVLNDAIYNRKIAVENRLKCELDIVKKEDTSEAARALDVVLNSGDDDYQIYATNASYLVTDAVNGHYFDLRSLKYLDFSKPWWYRDFNDQVDIYGHLYCADGSLSLSTLRSAAAVFFNKQLAEDLGIEDLYEIVDSGDWTIDRMTEITDAVYRDVNGNSERDGEDMYGLIPMMTNSFLCAFDISFLSKNEDGGLLFDCDFERLTGAKDKMLELYWESKGTYAEMSGLVTKEPLKLFSGGSVLFLEAMLYFAEDAETLRNMTYEYGILPLPKYDRSQKEYHSNPYKNATVFSIPVTNGDPDRAAAVLEALNAETYRRVITAYSDIALKGKYLNDSQSRRMFDLIINGMTVNRGMMYGSLIMELPESLWNVVIDGKNTGSFAAQCASAERKLPRVMELLNRDFAKLD